jgi:hypothetical protein
MKIRATRSPCSRPGFARHLVLMVKEPAVGRVKTRLAREVGAVRAAAFYRHTAAAVLGRLGAAREWRTILCVAPDAARMSCIWPASFQRLAQGGGDLGARLQRVIDRLPPGPVVIVGSDIPGIRASHIRDAFHQLGANDAVIGPSPDGGYWLIGLKRRPRTPRPFEAVRWSARETLADTLGNLEGLRIARVTALDDVDEARDLARFGGAHGRRILPLLLED